MSYQRTRNGKADWVKIDQSKTTPFSDQRHWIGQEINNTVPVATHPQPGMQPSLQLTHNENNFSKSSSRVQSPSKSILRSQLSNKSPMQLMQDLLKSASPSSLTELNPYYTRDSEQLLSQLLTNRTKLGNFIKRLQEQMIGLQPQVVRNYEVLVILLQQVSANDVQVRHGELGIEVRFNHSTLEKQEEDIVRLKQELLEKDEQIKLIVEEYETVIRNFNQTLEKLIANKQAKGKY